MSEGKIEVLWGSLGALDNSGSRNLLNHLQLVLFFQQNNSL